MATVAQTPVDVILGEAGGKTPAQRYADMVAIASVIANRAMTGRVTPQEVVAVQSQFNAYGKSLPAGTEAYRGLAEMAFSQVQKTGPVHNATYYATDKAKANLPSGLKERTKTENGHVYFTDPQQRSFKTAAGYVQPASYAQAPAPTTAGQALENLAAPSATGGRTITPGLGLANLAPMAYSMGPNRPNAPGAQIQGIVQSAVTDVLGPGHTVNITSGQGQYGSNRHRAEHGPAMDFNIVAPDGTLVTDQQALTDVAQAAMAKGAKGWGYGREYMGPATMHLDTVEPGPRQAHTWGSVGRANRDLMAEAREFSSMPASYYDRHLTPEISVVPTARPAAEMATTPSARQAEDASMAALATPQMEPGREPPAPFDALAALNPVSTAQAAPAPSVAPAVSPAEAYGQLAQSMQAAGVRGLGTFPATETLPALPSREVRDLPVAAIDETVPPATLPALPAAVPQTVAPAAQPMQTPHSAQQSAPNTGMNAIAGTFGAPQGTTARSAWGDNTFTSLGDGRVSFTNEFGHTRTLSPEDYGFPDTMSRPAAQAQQQVDRNVSQAQRGFLGIPEASKGIGGMARGFGGGLAGGMIGSVLGPVGGLLGSYLGSQIAAGKNPFSMGGNRLATSFGRPVSALSPNELSGILASNYTPGLSFPTAPTGGVLSSGNAPSFGDMAGFSPAAAAAISDGRAGLY